MSIKAPAITNSGLIFIPYDSSEKNLISPALDAGICPVLSRFFLLIEVSHSWIYVLSEKCCL
jgi:hypothetical protein